MKKEKPQPWTQRFGAACARAIDATVFAVSPVAGSRRIQARRAQEYLGSRHERRMARLAAGNYDTRLSGGGFESAEKSRDAHTWLTSKLSPDADLELDLEEMRLRSNSAYKNYELATGHVERRVGRVVGCGISLSPQIKAVEGEISEAQATAWNPVLRKAFERWACRAGGPGRPLYMIQRMVERHYEKDGEAFVQFGDAKPNGRAPVNLRVRVIHPRRIETPPEHAGNPLVRMGIEKDADGDVVAYWVRTTHPGDDKSFEYKHERVDAFFKNGLPRMIHVRDLLEADLSRGYPKLQVSLKRLKNTEELCEANLEAHIIQSCYAGFVLGSGDPIAAAQGAAATTDGQGRLIQELSPGRLEYFGDEVDDVKFSNPPAPPNSFNDYIEHQSRMAAAGAGSSYEMMSGDWQGLSYSGAKTIWNDESIPIDCRQHDLIELFLMPLWQNFVARVVTTTDLLQGLSVAAYRSQPWLYEAVKFIPPKKYSLDPAKERRAAHSDIAARLVSHADEAEQINGRPYEDILDDIAWTEAERTKRGLPLDMPGLGGTQAGDPNPEAEAGSEGEAKRQETDAEVAA